MRRILLLTFMIMTCICLSTTAQVPGMINYQGRLVDGTNLVNGDVSLELKLYDAATDGALLYVDSNTVLVVDGLYSTYIGDDTVSGLLDDALTNAMVYLEPVVNGTALSPRERLVSVPYAVRAEVAERVTPSVPVMWSGYSSVHGMADGENIYRLDVSEFNTATNYFSVSASTNGTVTFHRSGVYRINFRTISLKGSSGVNYAHIRLYKNGTVFHTSINRVDDSWTENSADVTWPFDVNDTFYLTITNPGDYAYHFGHTQYSRMQIFCEGLSP